MTKFAKNKQTFMTEIKGKWALVTGASRGIGALAAKFLAERGCNVVLQSRKKSHLDAVLAEVKNMGVEAYSVECQLEDDKDVKRMLKEIDDNGTNIEIVLNNAGIQVTYRAYPEYYNTPAEDFVESLKVNTIAPMLICYHYLPRMIKAGFGRIVNTTSGIRLEPEQAAYSASKAGLDKITMDLASKIDGTDVVLNLTDPGWCRTDLGGPNAPNAPESALPGVVLGVFADDKKSGRIISAQDYAGMTLEQALAKLK